MLVFRNMRNGRQAASTWSPSTLKTPCAVIVRVRNLSCLLFLVVPGCTLRKELPFYYPPWPHLKRVWKNVLSRVAWPASYRRLGTSMSFLSQIVIFLKIYVGGSLGSVAVLILNLPIHDHLFRSLISFRMFC